ncbi:MAG: PAS domain S-box protein [Thermoanaerobaculia bacterium]
MPEVLREVQRTFPVGSARRDVAIIIATLVAALAIEIALLLAFDLPQRRTEALQNTVTQLRVIADDRQTAISSWAQERLADTRVAASYVDDVLDGTTRTEHLSNELLDDFVSSYRYDAAYILDASNRVLIHSKDAIRDEPCIATFAERARTHGQEIIDFCRDQQKNPKIITAAPLLPHSNKALQAAAIVFVIDPHPYIYPSIIKWSTTTKTGESTLGRIEGREAVSLSPVRHIKAAPMTLRRPLERSAIGIAKQRGHTIRYRDYRNVPVVGEVRELGQTPWALIVKIDESEVFAPAVAQTTHLGVIVSGGSILVAWLAFFVLRSARVRKLRRAEEDFRHLFENTMTGILVCELIFDSHGKPVDHRLVLANTACERLTGINAKEEIGRTGREMTLQWPPEVLAQLYDVAMTGRSLQYERFNESVGAWYDTRVFAPRKGEFAHVFNDITDRKHAESLARTLSDDSLVGVFSYEDEVITYVNAAAARMFGYEPEDIIGQSPLMIVHPDDQRRVAEQIRRRMAREIGIEMYSFRGRRKDGAACWIDVAVNPVVRDGRMVMIGNLIDITERVNAESALQRLAIAVEQLTEGIVITDPIGVIHYVNPAFEQLTGLSHDEAIGQQWPLLERGDGISTSVRETLDRGETWRGVVRNERVDGSTFEEEVSVSPVRDSHGAIVNYVAVKRDITKERMLFAQILQAQKMEAVGTLAGGVAHDFNNLLQGMSMMVQIAMRSSGDPERLARTLADLSRLVQRASGLTKQLLLFSRKDVARQERVDLNDVVREMSKLLRRLVRENITFRIVLASEPLLVTADTGQLEQVLANLVVNASDAMPNGGRLEIRTDGDASMCKVIVQDTGEGIPAAIRDRVFEPFFTTKGKNKGTGLGLAVVHGIVTEHGGAVVFENVESGGTRFCITLPRANDGATASAAEDTRPPLPKGRGERLLVIEDEESVRTGLGAMLELLDYRPVLVGTATAAMQLSVDEPFDVVIADLVLPDQSGISVARELSQRWPRMKTILMSGYSNDEIQHEIAGTSLLVKPFDMMELANALRSVLAA